MPPLEGRWHGAAVTERCCRRTGLRRSDWVRRHLSVGFADSSPQGEPSHASPQGEPLEWRKGAGAMARTAELEKLGITVLRFSNPDVMQNFEGVCQCIEQHLTKKIGSP